jgi:hypothetical protein
MLKLIGVFVAPELLCRHVARLVSAWDECVYLACFGRNAFAAAVQITAEADMDEQRKGE